MRTIQRALISVYDKTGVIEFARELAGLGIEIISTGGTANKLKENNIPFISVSDYTGFPEILNGRVKTLHPLIHGGILAITENPQQFKEMQSKGLKPIDLVVVNLYPFETAISSLDCTFDEATENIDIGGTTLLRAAAKNCREVVAVVDPKDYGKIINKLQKNNKQVDADFSLKLAQKVFGHTAYYDTLIANYYKKLLEEEKEEATFPNLLTISLEKVQDLRYGENPHQKAACYRKVNSNIPGIIQAKKLQGKELSYNNLLDLNTALELASEFNQPAAIIIKHTNPCGVAVSDKLSEAYKKAKEADPISAFGGVIGFNRKVDRETARELVPDFLEAIVAPDYEEAALELLAQKKNLRLLKTKIGPMPREFEYKGVRGGVLIQENDYLDLLENQLKVVSTRTPTEEEWKALRFAWKVVKHIKSNAIVYATENQTIGIGAGQMSRVDSTKIAVIKAHQPLKGVVMASDAFFPFRDAIDEAGEHGISAIIQPGGSIRDQEIIAAANEYNIAMVFTNIRHFKH